MPTPITAIRIVNTITGIIQPNLKPYIKSSSNVSVENIVLMRIIGCSKIAVDCS
jgi:hypothetical protein